MNTDAMCGDPGNGEIMKTIGFLILSIGLIAVVYVFLVNPRYKEVQGLKNELATLEVKSRQYANFREFEDKISAQRERIGGVLRAAGVEWIVTDKSDQGVFEALGRICEAANVRAAKIDHVQSKNSGQQQIWDISFNATYDKLVVLISLLENSFVIDKFKIVSGGDSSLHAVSMLIHPIDVPAAAPASMLSGKDLFDMYNELEVFLKKPSTGSGPAEQSRAVIKDPMSFRYWHQLQ
jgi:hypothetical protein